MFQWIGAQISEYIESKFDQLLRYELGDDKNSSTRISGTGV